MYGILSQLNATRLRGGGVQATAENLHLAHFAGAGGGKKPGALELIKADQSKRVGDVLGFSEFHKDGPKKGQMTDEWRTNKPVFDKTVGQYRADLSKKHGQPPLTEAQLAAQSEGIPSMAMGGNNSESLKEYDPDRMKAIANYRPRVPPLMADDKGAGVTVNNIDNSKKSSSSGGTSSNSNGPSVRDEYLLRLMLMAITESNSLATR